MSQSNTAEDTSVDIITDIDEHLEFVEKQSKRFSLKKAAQTTISARIQHIRKRRADPALYMAVVGEFGAGKSTFVNALLRDPVLKSSVEVTTTTPTRLVHGTSFDISVSFRNDGKALRYSSHARQLWDKLYQYVPHRTTHEENSRTFVDLVTANDTVAAQIERVEISHPNRFLSNGTVIIDLPGANAEQIHQQIITSVIEEEADAAIIIIPAPYPVSKTLMGFVNSHLSASLRRCIFVATQLDRVSTRGRDPERVARDREQVISTIRTRLADALEIEPPVVHACAPALVLDALDPKTQVDPVWSHQFEKLEAEIHAQLRRGRTLIIAERLIHLLDGLLIELEAHLKTKWEAYSKESAALSQSIIHDLGAFAERQHGDCYGQLQQSLATSQTWATNAIDQHHRSLKEAVRNSIYSAQADTLAAAATTQASKLIGAVLSELRGDIHQSMNYASSQAQSAGVLFDQRFQEAYTKLQRLGGSVSAPPAEAVSGAVILDDTQILAPVQALIADLENATGNRALGGAGIGAIIGGIVAGGPVGIAIGAALGGWLGAKLGPSLDERKSQVWMKLESAIDERFVSVTYAVTTAFNAYERNAQQSLAAHIDRYIKVYRDLVAQMQHEQRTKQTHLHQLQEEITSTRTEIERRRDLLRRKRQLLAQH